MKFTAYSILPLISGIATLSLGLLVFSRNKGNDTNRKFLTTCLFLCGWLFSYSALYSTNNYEVALLLSKIGSFSVFFCAPLSYHLATAFFNYKPNKLLYFSYILLVILSPIYFFSDYYIIGLQKHFFGYYGKPGCLYLPTLLLYFIFWIAFTLTFSFKTLKNERLTSKQRIQAKYFIYGLIVAYLAGIDFLPKFGIEFYPFGSIFTFTWLIILSYAILKHHLLDITIVLKRSLVFSTIIAALTIFYFILVLLVENIFRYYFHYQALSIRLIYIVTIAITFTPLKNKLQSIIEKSFFKGTTVELANQVEQLRQEMERTEKLKAVSTLASGMAHEIKNPLTAIKTFTEYLPHKKDDPAFLEHFSKIVGKEVDRIDDLVHQLLNFAKPSPLSLKPTDIHQLLDETLVLLSSKFINNKITVSRAFESSPAILNIDPNQFRQALLNIFLNAIDAMPEGGVLTIHTNSLGDCFVISISDTGSGIAKKDLPHIFDPFFSQKDGGTGLGLSITHGIIKEHNGKINVESKTGKGTTFTIELPIKS